MSEVYDRDVTVWGSADGTEYLIKDLTTPHLVNVLNWIKKHNSKYRRDLYPFLEQEAQFRTMLSFCKNEAIPVKLDTGWYTTRNQGLFSQAKSLFYKHRTELAIRWNNHKILCKLLKFIPK